MVSDGYPGEIIESDEAKHRVICRSEKGPVYALKSRQLSSSDLKAIEIAKTEVIEKFLSPGQSTPLLKNVYERCYATLSTMQTSEGKEVLAYLLANDIAGYGPISILLDDKASIEEIEINSPESNIMIYHTRHGRCTTNLRFKSEKSFRFTINRMILDTTKELNSASPIIDACLPDGSRVHAQLKPYATNGAAATIRLGGKKGSDLKSLMTGKTVTPEGLAFLWLAIECGCNMLVAGAPASGKTSLLLALNAFVPRYQRILTVEEDVNELKFYSNFINVVSLEGSTKSTEASLKDQVINALHMRPERLIIGELRGDETKDVFMGSNVGTPFMATMHSSGNGEILLNKLRAKPMSVEPFLLTMLDLSVFLMQGGDSSRVIEDISEYHWLARNEINCAEGALPKEVEIIGVLKSGELDKDALKNSKVLGQYARKNLISITAALKELRKRALFLHEIMDSSSAYTPESVIRYWAVR